VISRKELVLVPTPHHIHKFVCDKKSETALKDAAIVTPTKQLYTESVLSMHMTTGTSRFAESVQPLAWESRATKVSSAAPSQQTLSSAVTSQAALSTSTAGIEVARVANSYQKIEHQLPQSLRNMNLSSAAGSGFHSALPSISGNVKSKCIKLWICK